MTNLTGQRLTYPGVCVGCVFGCTAACSERLFDDLLPITPAGLFAESQSCPNAACLLAVALSTVDGARLSERLQDGKGQGGSDNKLDLDKDRVVRTRQEMAAEAAELRKLFS